MNHRKSRSPSRRPRFAPGPCPRVNRAGLRCRHQAGHETPCEPGAAPRETTFAVESVDLDDESDAVLERQVERDEELRREEQG